MNKLLSFSVLLIATLVFSVRSNAQSGWKWAIGTTTYGNIYTEGASMAVDKSGNVFCGGFAEIPLAAIGVDSCKFGPFTMNGQNQGPLGLFITKVDSSGHYQWLLNARGSGVSYATSMVTDTAGNLYALVTFDDTCILGTDTFTAPVSSFYYALMKVSSSGTVLWAKKLGEQGVPAEYYQQAIGIDGAENLYISGVFSTPSITLGSHTIPNTATGGHNFDVFIAKLNSSGDVIWANGMGSPADIGYGGMAVSKGGSVYVIGGFSGSLTSGGHVLTAASGFQPYMVKLDSSGHTVWMSTAAENLLNYTAVTTDDHNRIYLIGSFHGVISYGAATFTPPTSGGYHILTACLDTSSAIMWARAAYDTGNSGKNPFAIGVDRCGKVVEAIGYSTVSTPATAYMVFGTDTLHVPDSSSDPILVAEYDSSGNYVRSSAISNGGEDMFGAHIDYTGNVYICSDIFGPKMVVAGDTLLNPSGESFFMAKYHYDDVICPDRTGVKTLTGGQQDISLYPNPTNGEFTISCTVPFSPGAAAELLDMTGRRLRTCNLYGNSTAMTVSGLTPGIYLCRILPGDGTTVVRKVVVE